MLQLMHPAVVRQCCMLFLLTYFCAEAFQSFPFPSKTHWLNSYTTDNSLSGLIASVDRFSTARFASTTITAAPTDDRVLPAAAKNRTATKFSRTNRIEGMIRWRKEVEILRVFYEKAKAGEDVVHAVSGSWALLVEVGKELLYSNIAEQVIELHETLMNLGSLLYDNKHHNEQMSLLWRGHLQAEKNLLLPTLRAFLAKKQLDRALTMLQHYQNLEVELESEQLSLIITELAVYSVEGLKAALDLRSQMLAKKVTPSIKASASILNGFWMFLNLDARSGMSRMSGFAAVGMNVTEVENLATDIAETYIVPKDVRKAKDELRMNYIVQELIRIAFRLGMRSEQGLEIEKDMDLEPRAGLLQEAKVIEGLSSSLSIMQHYNITWNIKLFDVLIDECLQNHDVLALSYLMVLMKQVNIALRTSTFNHLLKLYVMDKNSETAFNIVTKVMISHSLISPNVETWTLLLRSCMQSRKGRYLAGRVFQLWQENATLNMAENNWNQEIKLHRLCLSIYQAALTSNQVFTSKDVMVLMGKWGGSIYWDEASLLMVYEILINLELSDVAKSLLDLQFEADKLQSRIRKSKINNPALLASNVRGEVQVQYLLPPVSKFLLKPVILALVSSGRCDEALQLLETYCDYIKSKISTSPSLPISTPLDIDIDLFSVVIDGFAFLRKDIPKVLQLVKKMEQYDLQPDRRIYTALMHVFGHNGDMSSALGVFQEMKDKVIIDQDCLQSLLEICSINPWNLRVASLLLEDLVKDSSIDLGIYHKVILFGLFPDSRTLGKVLMDMEKQPLPRQSAAVEVSLDVLMTLVQAVREKDGIEAATEAMLFLGNVGIRARPEIMKYFRIAEAPLPNSPNSRHQLRYLIPAQQKQSRLQMEDLPEYAKFDTSLPRNISQRIANQKVKEPYFDQGSLSVTRPQMQILLKAVLDVGTAPVVEETVIFPKEEDKIMTAWEILYAQSEDENEAEDSSDMQEKQSEVEIVLNDATLSKLSTKELQRALEELTSIPNPISKQLLKIKNKIRDRDNNSNRREKADKDYANGGRGKSRAQKDSKKPKANNGKQNNNPGKNVKLNFIAKT